MGKRVKCMLPSKSKRPVVGGALGGRQQVEDPFRKCRFRVCGRKPGSRHQENHQDVSEEKDGGHSKEQGHQWQATTAWA